MPIATTEQYAAMLDAAAEGGLGSALLEALAAAGAQTQVRRLAVHGMPTSGRPDELLAWTGLDRTWIEAAARGLLELSARP
jgi:transketolase